MRECVSCFSCTNAVIDPGVPEVRYYSDGSGDPGSPAAVEDCTAGVDLGALTDAYDDDPVMESFAFEEFAAMRCGKYSPVLIEKCGVCGREINRPEISWRLWVVKNLWGDSEPACSPRCVEEGERMYEEAEADHNRAMEEDSERED
jgi:hypothetical protein